jgi:hypothetical protein
MRRQQDLFAARLSETAPPAVHALISDDEAPMISTESRHFPDAFAFE